MSEEIKEKLLDFIAGNFMVEREEIPLDRSLVDEGIVDSFGLIEIAAFIEREYKVPVSEEQMNRENFGSATRIINFIQGAAKRT